MRIRAVFLVPILPAILTACGGSGGTGAAPASVVTPTPAPVVLASATSNTCVTAQSTPENVALPDTGGITASFAFSQYDSGDTGCQNITISTGAAAAVTQSSNARRVMAASSSPIITMTLGQGLPTTLGLATVMTGVTLTTDPSLNFPDGTYNATVSIGLGVNQAITLPLVFTASNGKLTITGGTGLPVNLGSGAQLMIYDRGVIPPGFIAPTASPNASASPTAAASSTPTAGPTSTPIVTPTPAPSTSPGAPVADGTQIGTFSFTVSGLPSGDYGNGVQFNGTILYTNPATDPNTGGCTENQNTGDYTCVDTGTYFNAFIPTGGGAEPGVMTYTLSGLPAQSYRIDGCTGSVGYGGSGIAGTMTTPYATLAVADNCEVDLFSQKANIVNATTDHGQEYLIYSVLGPVVQDPPTSAPATNT